MHLLNALPLLPCDSSPSMLLPHHRMYPACVIGILNIFFSVYNIVLIVAIKSKDWIFLHFSRLSCILGRIVVAIYWPCELKKIIPSNPYIEVIEQNTKSSFTNRKKSFNTVTLCNARKKGFIFTFSIAPDAHHTRIKLKQRLCCSYYCPSPIQTHTHHNM